jgi:hypothetical protein
VAVDGGYRHAQAVVVGPVPADGVRAVVEAVAGELVAQVDDQVDGGLCEATGAGVRAP